MMENVVILIFDLGGGFINSRYSSKFFFGSTKQSPNYGIYLRVSTPMNKFSKLALELCIENYNFAAF